MGLNIQKGNMYGFVTHTWNTVKGECPHACTYCYMHRFKQNPIRFDERELRTDLGRGNKIFVGSSCDMWAHSIPNDWIRRTLEHCAKFDNEYVFQTKNPENIRRILPHNSTVIVTIESNRFYGDIMQNSPSIEERLKHTQLIRHKLMVTVEPILDFDLLKFLQLLIDTGASQINIGADSGHNNLPEPSYDKLNALITGLLQWTDVFIKPNLNRLLTK